MEIAYLNFSKAFGTLSYNILIGKLRKCGIDECIVRWIYNRLSNRAWRIVITGAESSWRPIDNSIPQGSVLALTHV